MRMKFNLKPDAISAQGTTQDVTMLSASWAIIYGAVTILGGKIPWSAPAYDTAILVPGAPESWAIVLVTVGISIFVAMYTGNRKLLVTGLFLGGAWNLFFAMSFFIEWWDTFRKNGPGEGIGLGPSVTYLFLTGVFLLRVNTYRSGNAVKENSPRV